MPTSSNIRQSTAEWIEQNQGMPRKFRILVIGRANAGKTSILRKFCNATGEPMILSPDNEPIDSSTLDPSLRRGEHDIENQMIFDSNPDFIFHDSRGFEAGGAGELKIVQEFLKKRSEAKNVNKQLHAIWYCIPTSDDRPITRAEQTFFNEYGTGLVPVILLWTKTDFLDLAKIKQLMKKGIPKPEAMQQAPQQAWADYEKKIYPQFDKFKYPPKAFVVFRKMHEEAAIDFKDLVEKTTAALSTEELRRFFLSTQQNLVEPCIGYGIRRIITSTELDLLSLFKEHDGNWANFIAVVLGYFPQFFVRDNFNYKDDEDDDLNYNHEHHNLNSISKIMSPILSGLCPTFNLKEVIYCAIVGAIIGDLSFFLRKELTGNNDSLERAVQIYQQSACDTSVKQSVEKLFKSSRISAILNRLKSTHASHTSLYEDALQIVMDNLFTRKDANGLSLDPHISA